MNSKFSTLFLILSILCATTHAQKKVFSYSKLIEETNVSIKAKNDSVIKPSRGISFKGDRNEELPTFNKNYRGSFNRFAQKDLSYAITGDKKGSLFNNKFSLDVINPLVCLSLSYWLGKNEPGYKSVFNKDKCAMETVEGKKMKVLPFRMAAAVEISAASKNNVATLFTTKGNALNSDLRIKPSLVIVFQGNYKLSSPECFDKLKSDILKKEKNIQDNIALSAYLQKKIQKKIDSLSVKIQDNLNPETKDPIDENIDAELKAEIRKLQSEKITEEEYGKTQKDGLQSSVDNVIYGFPYQHRVYYWLSLSGDWAWHDYARYNKGLTPTGDNLDDVKFSTYSFGPSFNVMYAGAPGTWGSSFFAGTKVMFGSSNNAVNSTPKTYSIYTVEKITDSASIYTKKEGPAYAASDFKNFWNINWNTNFIWYLDPKRIFGTNVYADLTQILTATNARSIWTMGQGLVFSVPSPTVGDQCITNFTLFVQEADIKKTTATSHETGAAVKSNWSDLLTVGFKVGVPFGVLGSK